MPDATESFLRAIVREELERIGIYASDTPNLSITRRNFVALDELAPHADAIVDLVKSADAEKSEAQDSARAAKEDRRERRNKRYEVALGFLASIAQYGAAGALGYGVSWVLAHVGRH